MLRPHSIRQRLLALVLLPLLLMAIIMAGMLYFWTTEVGYRHLLMKVSTDLAVANERFYATQENYLAQLALLAQTHDFQSRYRTSQQYQHNNPVLTTALVEQLLIMQAQSGLDYIQLIDISGCDLLVARPCATTPSPLLTRAVNGFGSSGVELLSAQQLTALSPSLAERAQLILSETEKAVPTERHIEQRGMVLHLVYPLNNKQGHTEAFLNAGLLMNGNSAFVDQIKDTVYGEGSLAFGSVGTVTIFLDDIRISTNVPAKQAPGQRALGTRVSELVRQKVLVQGERWLDRAFVVSDWYISGYLPIIDVYGKRVGMIYAGFLEAPFKREFYHWLWQLLIIFAAIVLACGFLVVRGAKGIFTPIEAMVTVIGNIRAGHRERIALSEGTSTELMTLGVEFNLMLAQLEQQHDHIQNAAELLEEKVHARTQALNEHIKLLKRTREQLIAKGKLAAIGELTAGIAHEINNPTTVILGYLDLLVVELGDAGELVSEEVQLIVQQVERIRTIINDLLQFSRPGEYRAALSELDINHVIRATQVLVKHDLAQKEINLRMDLRATITVSGNRQQLQQVLINLMVNAVAAINTRGDIIIRSRNWRSDGVLFSIRDTGCGIKPDVLERIFDPFFSHRAGGTGLGLSVSYSILQSMDAEVAVRSRFSVGSIFYIWLPKFDPKKAPLSIESLSASEDKMTQC